MKNLSGAGNETGILSNRRLTHNVTSANVELSSIVKQSEKKMEVSLFPLVNQSHIWGL